MSASAGHDRLLEVERVEVISLVDNSVDFASSIERDDVRLAQSWVKERMGEGWVKENFRLPIAEYGLSMLIRVFSDGGPRTVLFDAGLSPETIIKNAKGMGIDLTQVEAIVLSHGHHDHFGGLISVVEAVGKRGLPIIVHEDMFKRRGVMTSSGAVKEYPGFPIADQIKPARFVYSKRPRLIASGTALISGEIPRETNFEKGLSKHYTFIDGVWRPDPWVWDDRALIINVKGKGLIVLSGCAHAGIINTVLYAKRITGVTNVYAIIGGFHLAGKECEQRVNETVENLKRLSPSLIVPLHCSGWRCAFAVARAMPQAFVWNSVGNLYQL